MTTTFQTVTVESAAEAYVRSRGKARFLSIAQAIRAIRTMFPACRATDREWKRFWLRHASSTAFPSLSTH